jgi:MoaA/NifB/PqqE/SkfB family radical SAM enzyme
MRNERVHRFRGQWRVNSFFPPWPSRAFGRFMQAMIRRWRVPVSCYIAVTSECPFACAHCSLGGRQPGQLPLQTLLRVIRDLKSVGCCIVGFTGGEPLLRSDLETLIAAAGPEMSSVVFTTGWGLDTGRARSLAQAGLACLTVGVESSSPQEHDAVRGRPGSWRQAQASVAAARAAGLYTALSTIGTSDKIASGRLEEIHSLARDWGAMELRVLSPVSTGQAVGAGFAPGPGDLGRLYDFHVRHNRRGKGPAVACFAYLESSEMFGCGGGFHHLFIDARGNACPCDLAPLAMGNITEEPLADVWRRMGELFPRPRRRCLMTQLPSLTAGEELPIPRARSEALCRSLGQDPALPEAYRHL